MANTPGKQTAHPAQEDGADGSRNGGGAQGVRACAPTLAFVMNGKTALPVKAWKAEYAKLTAERETLNRRYLALKGEVKEAEQIRRSVYNILRQEQREQQPRRTQDGGWRVRQNKLCKHYSTENHYRTKKCLNLLEYKSFQHNICMRSTKCEYRYYAGKC